MIYLKKIIACILLAALLITGNFLFACDGCKDKDGNNKTTPTGETEVDVSGMWDDELGEAHANPDANDSDYTGWVK